jgi:chromosome segregation ATPase
MQAAVTNSQLLESELQSARLEKQMLSDDYNAVCGNLNTLNTAFSEMQTELIQLKVKLDTAKETQKRSESSDLKLLTANCELRALRDARSDLEVQVEDLRRDKNKLDAQVAVQAKEIEQYKAMVDRMKQKIRDLTPTDKREFLDSFEEVMREEMATMREAFEHKLRTAKGEVEALSKKHQQDLARIRESHSSAGRL